MHGQNTAGAGSESVEQQALILWWGYACHRFGLHEFLLFAIPNGGRRDAATGARLKAEGVRPGVPDLFLAVPSGSWHGLFIEMKRRKLPSSSPRVSKAQKAAFQALSSAGYACRTAFGWEEARIAVSEYLSAKNRTDSTSLQSSGHADTLSGGEE